MYFYRVFSYEEEAVLMSDKAYTKDEFEKMCSSLPTDWLLKEEEKWEEEIVNKEDMKMFKKDIYSLNTSGCVERISDYLIRNYGFKPTICKESYFIK